MIFTTDRGSTAGANITINFLIMFLYILQLLLYHYLIVVQFDLSLRHPCRIGFTNQVMAQIEFFTKGDNYENKVYVLPKILDEKVARLHLDKIGVNLTQLSQEQADYINVPVEGPYKPDHYRY